MNLIELRAFVNSHINTKVGTDKISGADHNEVLNMVIDSLIEITGTGFGGDMATGDNPGAQTNPIFFLASEVGTYTYCAGLKVTALPAFIIWDGSKWKLNQIGVPKEETPDTGLRGIARSGDPEPSNPQVGDWYMYIDTAELAWPGSPKAKPGIIILVTNQPTNSWVLVPFGDEGGGREVIEKRQERFSLIGHTIIPTAFEAAVSISSVPKFLNLSGVKLIDLSDSSEIPILAGGTLEELPIAVPAGDYNYAITYLEGTESGVLLINFS